MSNAERAFSFTPLLFLSVWFSLSARLSSSSKSISPMGITPTIGRLADLKVVIPKPVRPEGEEVPDGCGGSIYPVFNMVADTVQSYLAEYMSLVPADIGFNHNNLE